MATMYYRPYTAEPTKDNDGGQMPAHNVLDTILPEYQYIFMDQPQTTPRVPQIPVQAVQQQAKPVRLVGNNVDQAQMSMIDHQQRELDRYRLAVQKMGQDILALRHSLRGQEVNNTQLRHDLSQYNDSTKFMLDSSELDGLTKPELVSRYVALKSSLQNQTAELNHYKDRVQTIQNELIKKNEQEKEYIKLTNAHKTQQQLVQRLQEMLQREKKLKDACKKQEQVIEKMEKLIKNQDQDKDSNKKKDARYDAVMAENARLRGEMETLKRDKSKKSEDDFEQEKMELYQQIDKAEGRIMSLEKQLAENARKWGKEKNEINMKLAEYQHGFSGAGSTNPNLHYYPSNPTRLWAPLYYEDEYDPPRRYTKAPRSRPIKLKPIAYP